MICTMITGKFYVSLTFHSFCTSVLLKDMKGFVNNIHICSAGERKIEKMIQEIV